MHAKPQWFHLDTILLLYKEYLIRDYDKLEALQRCKTTSFPRNKCLWLIKFNSV